MKNILFIALTSFVLITSCTKDDDMNDPGIPSNTFSAEINGQTFTAEAQSQINNIFVQIFTVAGVVDLGNGEYETLVLLLDFPIGETLQEGTYEYSGSECIPTGDVCGSISYGIRELDEEVEYSSVLEDDNGEAKFIFTDLDYRPGGSAKGTFSAVLFNEAGEEIRMTDGKFNVTIAE